jgi:putative ABC transport system permease protein
MLRNTPVNLRLALRGIARNPGFAALIVATMALGIGANTTMFSVIRAVFLRPLPLPDPEQLVTLWESDPERGIAYRRVTPANFVDWIAQAKSFTAVGTLPNWDGKGWPFNILGPEGTDRILGIYASSGFFRVLGVAPALGRDFGVEDDRVQGERHVIISHSLWLQRFQGDPSVLGRTLYIDTWRGGKFTIIGVMPQGFDFPAGAKIWISLADWGGGPMPGQDATERCCAWYTTFARLKPGVTAEQAEAELTIIGRRISQRYPDMAKVAAVKVVPMREHMVEEHRLALFALFGAVACILLIACANVANLLLSRGVSRASEMLTRMALGATVWQIGRQLMAESLVLCGCGAAGGLLVALWAQDLLVHAFAGRIQLIETSRIDWAVLAFTALISVASAVACGLMPLVHWRTARWHTRGQTESRSSRRVRSGLVVGEVALSAVLVTGAGLLMRTVEKLREVDFGVQTQQILAVSTDFNVEGLRDNAPRFLGQVLPRLAALPGVRMAAAATWLPIENGGLAPITLENQPLRAAAESPQVSQSAVTPGYFSLMGIPLKRGRLFTEADTAEGKLVAVVSETAWRRYWPNEDPIGKRFAIGSLEHFGSFRRLQAPEVAEWREIVGVVGDVRAAGFNSGTLPQIYYSYRQFPVYDPTILLRTVGDPILLASAARDETKRTNNRAVVTEVRSMDQVVLDVIAEPRLRASIVTIFASLAVLLGMLGIYGLTSYTVTRRTQEIGIRMALGAREIQVGRMVVGHALSLAACGAALGLIASLAAARVLASLMFGIGPFDPLTLMAACLLLVGSAVVASYLPVRRAMRIDPASSLRNE